MSISLSPQGHLHWDETAGSDLGAARARARDSSASEPSARLLLRLATRELETPLPPAASKANKPEAKPAQIKATPPTKPLSKTKPGKVKQVTKLQPKTKADGPRN
jgi:hypothetical protein